MIVGIIIRRSPVQVRVPLPSPLKDLAFFGLASMVLAMCLFGFAVSAAVLGSEVLSEQVVRFARKTAF